MRIKAALKVMPAAGSLLPTSTLNPTGSVAGKRALSSLCEGKHCSQISGSGWEGVGGKEWERLCVGWGRGVVGAVGGGD